MAKSLLDSLMDSIVDSVCDADWLGRRGEKLSARAEMGSPLREGRQNPAQRLHS